MPMIFRIAIRNLGEHKVKSAIIVGLVAFGMLLLVLSSSVLETAKVGIERSFTKNFTGHILVGPAGKNGENPTLFGVAGFSMDMSGPKVVPDYEKVYSKLSTWKGVEALNPQIFGGFSAELNDTWVAGGGAFGFNSEKYMNMFPGNISMVSGNFLADGEEGVMVSERMARNFKDKAIEDFLEAVKARLPAEQATLEKKAIKDLVVDGKISLLPEEQAILDSATIVPGTTKLKFMGFNSGSRIKQLEVRGIYKFNSSNTSIDTFFIMDLSSIRYLSGMIVGSATAVKVDESIEKVFDESATEDDFFGDSLVAETTGSSSRDLTEADFEGVLGDVAAARELSKPDEGAWHYILLRLDNADNINATIAELNTWFAAEYPTLRAVNWEAAAGDVASFVSAVQIVINILILVIVLISVIIIMNTMVASIIERTGEIGTMRALGAQKSFVREVFMAESVTLSAAGGLIGLLVAGLIIGLFNITGLPAGHELIEIAFGGKVLYPALSLGSVVNALIIIIVVGLVSSLYPTLLAMKVPPIKAMQSN